MSPPPRRTRCRCPAFSAAGPRPTECRPGFSCRGCSRPPAAQARLPAVLVGNSRGRRQNRKGSRRPRDLCRVHDCRGPKRYHCLREFTSCQNPTLGVLREQPVSACVRVSGEFRPKRHSVDVRNDWTESKLVKSTVKSTNGRGKAPSKRVVLRPALIFLRM